jgi:hypothetical protein
MYSSTCFGRLHAHHQELNNCSSGSNCSSAVGRGRAGRPHHDHQHCYYHAPTVKPEAATAVVELLMMGVRTSETCWAVHKRQVVNLRNCWVRLVDLFEPVSFFSTIKWMIFVTEKQCVFYETNIKFSGAFAKLRKATISSAIFVRPSVRIEQLGSHWTAFHYTWH